MGTAAKTAVIHSIAEVGKAAHKAPRARSSIVLEILPDGTLAKTFVNVAQEDCVEMLGGLAMAQIRILKMLQGE